MNELQKQSQSRNGATVLWITIHTAEGPTDEFPSRPDLDADSADDLLRFFEGKTDRSCHAVCDDDKIIDNLVSYDRAAWTLRNGNNRSDNLEMCGLASWTRAQWLTHDGMLRNAARWVVSRLRARSMTPKRLTVSDVRARSARGYMDHNTYTVATGDGTHWDVGPHFPWDVFGNYVTSFFTGGNGDDDVSVADVEQALKNVLHIDNLRVPDGQLNNNNLALSLTTLGQSGFNADNAIKSAIAAVKADTAISGQHESDILDALEDLSEKVSALTPPAPEKE
jgi:hypothetical protein